jgi:LmbE family N-acetylglucosaminyl deacetylase
MSSLNCPDETESGCLRALRHGTRLFVVSPHLDDAVFGCAGLLALHPGAIVCTVFAGEPPERMQTPWDASCGFADSHVAMRVRWREEERALAICEAQPLRLGFLDAQYGATPAVEAVAEALAAQYRRFAGYLPVCPLGLWHSDHVLVGAACRLLLRTGRFAHCIAYEDAIYRAQPSAFDPGPHPKADDR